MYILDKVEGNPTQINGHPAWGAEFAVGSEKARAMDVITNSFCAVSGVFLSDLGVRAVLTRCAAGRRRAGQRDVGCGGRQPGGHVRRRAGSKPEWRRAV